MRRYGFPLFLPTILVLTASAVSQPQAAPPKPQTARQALIEIVTKGGDAILKHLTVEVQDALKANKKFNSAGMAMLGSMKPDSGLQSFEAGEVLFIYNEAAQGTKYEVHVDNDDLAGDEDSLLLSLHTFRDEKEQDIELGLMSLQFTVSMKLQQNVWRLNSISVGADFPVGDAKFVEKAFLKSSTGEAFGLSSVALAAPEGSVHVSFPAGDVVSPGMAPERIVQMLAYAESMFARQHPEVGFTCSFSELAESSKMMGVDQQVNTGSYNGYRFALAGCGGKPAGSYQIIGEPLAGKGTKAFCTDATQNLRSSDDGRGATCLASGRVQNIPGEATFVEGHFEPAESKPKQ
jgi:hypothetical protein